MKYLSVIIAMSCLVFSLLVAYSILSLTIIHPFLILIVVSVSLYILIGYEMGYDPFTPCYYIKEKVDEIITR